MEKHPLIEALTHNLERHMARSGMSALALAQKAGVGRTAVYDILYGKSRNPGIITLVRLAAAMDISLTQLIVGDDTEDFAAKLAVQAEGLPEDDRARLLAMISAWLSASPK